MTVAGKSRLSLYLTGLAGMIGLAFAAMGLADFDAATGTIDIAPFNIYALFAAVPGIAATVVAPLALLRGWGK